MLLKPDIKLPKITDIKVQMLEKRGIKALLLDVDNTMSTHHGMVLTDGLMEWIDSMKREGIALSILSNSNEKRVAPFARKVGLDYTSMGLKPLPFKFFRAARSLGFKKSQTAIVGDQIFTDILGGNISGLKTILLTPIKLEDKAGFRFKRRLERAVYKMHRIEDLEE